MRAASRGVIAVAVAVMALARTAHGGETDVDTAPASAAAPIGPPSAPASTPLTVRPTRPLTLDGPRDAPATGWKVLALMAAVGCGAWVWKRRKTAAAESKDLDLHILRRTAVGVRSELLLVELDGQRLLLGVTPHAIQNLYIVPGPEAADPVFQVASGERALPSPSQRLDAMLEARAVAAATDASRTTGRARTVRGTDDAQSAPIEGQARGLRASGAHP